MMTSISCDLTGGSSGASFTSKSLRSLSSTSSSVTNSLCPTSCTHIQSDTNSCVRACVWENWSSPHRPLPPPPLRSPPAAAPELDQRRERGSCRCLRTETNIETMKTLFSSQISSQFKDNVSACAPFPVWVSPATPSRWRCPTEQQSELFPAKTNTH